MSREIATLTLKQTLLFFVLMALLACQQKRPLVDYEPESKDEQALKNLLLTFQDGVINKDAQKIENLIHEKASIMIGTDHKILSKAEYTRILPARLAENASIALGTPKISVSGDKAEVKIYMSRGSGYFLVLFKMKMENNQWYILGWEY